MDIIRPNYNILATMTFKKCIFSICRMKQHLKFVFRHKYVKMMTLLTSSLLVQNEGTSPSAQNYNQFNPLTLMFF